MFPIIEVPQSIRQGMVPYRAVFCREEGFAHVSRYVTGLIVSPNKTLQGIDARQVWEPDKGASRRAMHAAVFEARWDDEHFMKLHRTEVAKAQHGGGRQVIRVDGTFVPHDRGPKIFATTKAWDWVDHRTARFQPVVTAVVSNRQRVDGLEVRVQEPSRYTEEGAYWTHTAQERYDQMQTARARVLELLHQFFHPTRDGKRTEIALELVRLIEAEGHYPQAHSAFDTGGLTVALTQLIAGSPKQWVSA